MTIGRQIMERITIRSTKLNIELHGSLNSALTTKSSTSKKILDILFGQQIHQPPRVYFPILEDTKVGDIEVIRGGENINPKKVAKRTKISKKLLAKASFNKGNVLKSSLLVMIMSLT
jgi:hypothetical protein